MRILIFLSILFASCKHIGSDTYVQNQYNQFSNDRHNYKINDTIIVKDSNLIAKTFFKFSKNDNSLKSIKNWLQNNPNPYGHYFKFENHELEGYYFLCGDNKCHSYELNIDAKKQVYSEKGSPFVDFFAPAEIRDSLNNYTLLFSTFPRSTVLSFTINGNNMKVLQLKESKLFPFLYEANLICDRDELEKGIIIKTKADGLVFSLPGLIDSKEFIDTLRTNTLLHQN